MVTITFSKEEMTILDSSLAGLYEALVMQLYSDRMSAEEEKAFGDRLELMRSLIEKLSI